MMRSYGVSLAVVCASFVATAEAAKGRGYPIQVKAESATRFRSLAISTPHFVVEFGPGTLVEIECEPGVTGAAVIARGVLATKGEIEPAIEEQIHGAMVRCNPQDFELLIAPDGRENVVDEGAAAMASHLLRVIFRHCWHSGPNALIPPVGAVSFVVYGKTHGDLVCWDSQDGYGAYSFTKRVELFKHTTAQPDDDRDAQSEATAEGLYHEGTRLWRAKDHEAAVKTWQTLIQKFPASNRAGCAAAYMGQCLSSIKEYARAEEALRLAAEKFGHHRYGNGVEVGGYAYFYLVHVHCEAGEYGKAGEVLRTLVEKHPYATGHRLGDAVMSLRAKRWFYDKLKDNGVDVKPLDDLIAQQKDPANFDKLNGRQLYVIAQTLKREGQSERAIVAYRQAAERFPNESFAPYALVFAFQLQIECNDSDGAKQTALAMIDRTPDAKVRKGGPLAAIGHYSLGVAHLHAKEYQQAAALFEKVISEFAVAKDMDGKPLRVHIAELHAPTLRAQGIEIGGIRE